MKCPKCGSRAKIYFTATHMQAVHRNHKCPICQHTFATVEVQIPLHIRNPEKRLVQIVQRVWPDKDISKA